MTNMRALVIAGLVLLAGCGDGNAIYVSPSPGVPDAGVAVAATTPAPLRVLVFMRETEWFHPSNPVAERVLSTRWGGAGFKLNITRDQTMFRPEVLDQTDVVAFVMSSGIVLDQAQRDAFHTFILRGGGWMGVHSASYTDHDSPFMDQLVGAAFRGHPPVMPGVVNVEAAEDPIVSHVAPVWRRSDEWYTFKNRPEDNPRLQILLSLDEKATLPDYPGAEQPSWLAVGRHPLAWKQELGAARSIYIALGHTEESWAEENFLLMLDKAALWAGRR